MNHEENRDPYAPPPRHRDHSGAMLRIVLVAGLLGAAVWGYTQFDEGPGLVAEAPQEQSLADSSLDTQRPEAPPLGEPATAPEPAFPEDQLQPPADAPSGR